MSKIPNATALYMIFVLSAAVPEAARFIRFAVRIGNIQTGECLIAKQTEERKIFP